MSNCLLITTYERSTLLMNNLSRLIDLTLPDEILVVDDGGEDGCEEVVDCWRSMGIDEVRYIYTHNPGSQQCSHARNVGILNTDAEVVIVCEPEMVFQTDVIAQLLARREKHPDQVISAGTIHHEAGPTNHFPAETTKGWVAPWIALFERQWLLDIGGWDEEMPDTWGWEDVDLLTRLRVSGHGQIIDQNIEATHQWHEPRWTPQEANEAYFKAKDLDNSPALRRANLGLEWGQIKHA